ncbi:unnamed protein product [Leptosia nina]|uniref:DUF4780 domain-containing protein n=1 Tax=Leptosia nina TaxID=320188 RepID=A0AAV1JIL4_9NEOP
MMITIHGLPKYVKYQDLKQIIRQECKISDFILDNLLIDTNDLKKVRVGLADDNEGAHVIKCLNGYRLSGHILQVAPVGKSGNPVQNNYVDQSTSVSWNNQTQWTNPVAPQQNSYPFQQPQQIGNYLSTVPNQQLRTQVNERPSILSRIGPPSQGFSIAQKNSPNPSSQTRPSYFRTVELIDTSTLQQGRHAESNYDLSQDKSQNPVLKEALNIRGTSIGTQNPGHYQTSNPWNQQFKREQINEKVHPFNETQKPQFSQGRVQDIAAGRIDSSGRNIPLIPTASNRFSTSERPSPTNRHISPQDTRTSSARRISPPSRLDACLLLVDACLLLVDACHLLVDCPVGRQPSPSRRPSPPCRRPSPLVRNMSPPSRRVSPFRRRFSPSSRRESPSMRDVSPNRVRVSSGRNMIQTERPQSPSGARPVQGRMSPRRFSPSERNIYHERRISPSSFKEHLSREGPRSRSPKKGITSGQHRYSPTRNFQKDLRAAKEVRPAYEPSSATTEAMYADGFRPIDKLQYTQGREDRIDRWSNREQKIRKVHDEERGRMTKFEPARPMEIPRIIEKELKRSRSRNRESRSPRRDRSPLRDRYKRHSPSPRSPRRSWALEKRRSPEDAKVPPPPSWPVEESQRMKDCHDKRQSYSKRIDEPRGPVWDINKYESKFEDQRDNRSGDDRRNFEHANIASRKDAAKWKAVGNDSPKRTPPRYNPEKNERTLRRNEVDARHEERRHEESRMRLNRREFEENRREPDDRRYGSEFKDASELAQLKQDLSRRIEKKSEILKKQEELHKEIEDVYKRAVDFTKKAEMYKKSDRSRERDYNNERHRDEHDPKDFNLPTLSRFNEERHSDWKYQRDNIRPKSREGKTSHHHEENKMVESNYPITKSPGSKTKREKACEAVSEKILTKFGDMLPKDISVRVFDELKYAVSKIFKAMFGDEDVSFIEMIIKFNSKHSTKDEEKIYDSILSSFPSQYRILKRSAKDEPSDIPAKLSKKSPIREVTKVEEHPVTYQTPHWDYSFASTAVEQMQANAFMAPYMVPFASFVPAYTEPPQNSQMHYESENEGFNLFLCKDNFQPINCNEAEIIKDYIIQKIVDVTQSSQGWAPDFTLKGLQSPFRYEVVTRDAVSRDWLLNISFSDLTTFNVLVYTKEELWYERAAVWLPGHSKCRSIEPLEKLKLQNKFLDSINIGKWKLVKKIVTANGTRIYVDMPPSSARALESHKMMLSFELQKVNVFLKAVAVDKNAFDAGLRESSIKQIPNLQNSPMPSLPSEQNAVRFCAKGDKPISLAIARKIKDSIIYHLFKYHQMGGTSRTDFSKYGFITPGFFGVLPENDESKRWLFSLQMGNINKQPIIVFGAEELHTFYIKMFVMVPGQPTTAAQVFDIIRSSNQSIKGIYFHKWRRQKLDVNKNANHAIFEVHMDIESVERISRMKFKLDYIVDEFRMSAAVKSEYPFSKLEEIIQKHKQETTDSYDVANMELSSGSEQSDGDVIQLSKCPRSNQIKDETSKPNSRHEERYKYVSHKKRSLSQRKEDKQTPFTLKGSSGKTQAYTESVDSVKEQSDKSVANSKTADNAMQQEIEDMFPQEGSEDMKQLGPVTTRILEHELRHIMIKVWQEFPDEPPTEEEKFVVEKFRNEAGDDIRDIIGLNVTKRLLKVHNKLIVKVCFLSRPERAHILAFLKKYRISGFKRITSENNTFAARLKRIEDFDKLCSDKEIICGNAELTITPCYKFIKRPANLITKFLDNSHDENPNETADKRVIEKKAQTKVKSASEEIQERDKSLPTTSIKKDVANKKNESEIDYKQNTETTTQKSNNVKLDVPTKNMDRVQPLPKLVNKTAAFDKTSIDKPQSTKLLKDLPSEPQRTMAKVPGKCNKNVSISKEYERIKPCKGTENLENTKVTKKDQEKPKNYEKFKKQTIEKVKKPAYNKELPSKKSFKQKIQTKDVINKYEDYEEMDDEDILALLSEGVLLDQCGSDDE